MKRANRGVLAISTFLLSCAGSSAPSEPDDPIDRSTSGGGSTGDADRVGAQGGSGALGGSMKNPSGGAGTEDLCMCGGCDEKLEDWLQTECEHSMTVVEKVTCAGIDAVVVTRPDDGFIRFYSKDDGALLGHQHRSCSVGISRAPDCETECVLCATEGSSPTSLKQPFCSEL